MKNNDFSIVKVRGEAKPAHLMMSELNIAMLMLEAQRLELESFMDMPQKKEWQRCS